MTDWKALCAELVEIVENYCNPDEYSLLDVVNVLNQARAALAQPETLSRLHHCPTHGQQPENAWGCPECVREMRQQLAQPEPVPAAERPWEREGWCDAKGQCWMGDGGGDGFVPSWRLCKPSDSCLPWSLPHHALPLP